MNTEVDQKPVQSLLEIIARAAFEAIKRGDYAGARGAFSQQAEMPLLPVERSAA